MEEFLRAVRVVRGGVSRAWRGAGFVVFYALTAGRVGAADTTVGATDYDSVQGTDVGGITGLATLMNTVVKILTGNFAKAICVACLAGCAIAYVFNKDNEKMKRNIIAVAIGVAILIGSAQVVKMVWGSQ